MFYSVFSLQFLSSFPAAQCLLIQREWMETCISLHFLTMVFWKFGSSLSYIWMETWPRVRNARLIQIMEGRKRLESLATKAVIAKPCLLSALHTPGQPLHQVGMNQSWDQFDPIQYSKWIPIQTWFTSGIGLMSQSTYRSRFHSLIDCLSMLFIELFEIIMYKNLPFALQFIWV